MISWLKPRLKHDIMMFEKFESSRLSRLKLDIMFEATVGNMIPSMFDNLRVEQTKFAMQEKKQRMSSAAIFIFVQMLG
jgi:hypothetical protein